MEKNKLVEYLNTFLKIQEFEDTSKNWLQVDNSKTLVKKIGYSVDASTYIFQKAKEEKVDMILTHHGIFWGHEQVLVGNTYERLKILIGSDIALYASHLPLDAHKEVGNNIWLLQWFCNIFWLSKKEVTIKPFGFHKWTSIGYGLQFKNEIHISNLQTRYAEVLGLQKKLYNFWKIQWLKSIAFLSWWGWSYALDAKQAWYDVLVTGEAVHYEILWAKELWISLFLWGHYETEKIGPKLLAHHLQKKFKIETVFLDEKY